MLTNTGFLHALKNVLRLKRRGLLWCGIPCGSPSGSLNKSSVHTVEINSSAGDLCVSTSLSTSDILMVTVEFRRVS